VQRRWLLERFGLGSFLAGYSVGVVSCANDMGEKSAVLHDEA
jgi:hypothetical protein